MKTEKLLHTEMDKKSLMYYSHFSHFSFSLHVSSVWMPTLWVMELGRQLCGKMRKSNKRAPLSSPPTTTWGLEIHFYLPDVHQLEYLKGCYTAEVLCVDAAKKCCELKKKKRHVGKVSIVLNLWFILLIVASIEQFVANCTVGHMGQVSVQ